MTCAVETLDDFVDRPAFDRNLSSVMWRAGNWQSFWVQERPRTLQTNGVYRDAAKVGRAIWDITRTRLSPSFMNSGYECFVLSEGMLCPFTSVTEETVETNFFFLHSQRHIEMVRFLGLLR